MGARRFAVAGIAAVTVLAVACGKSREEQAFDEVGRQCAAIPSQQTTIRQVDIQFRGATVISDFRCPAPGSILAPVDGTCPVQTPEDPQCSVFYEWQSYDPGLCSPQGGCCFICEVRVTKSSSSAGVDTPICGSRWLSGQFCQFL